MRKRSSKSRPIHSLIERLEERRLMSTTWGGTAKLIGQDAALANFPTINGAGASIAILDSGINYNDPALGGGYGPGHKVVAGYDFVDNDNDPMDTDGHGTGLASVIGASAFTYNGATYQGVAQGADLIDLRVDDGTFGWSQEAPLAKQALQWVIDHRDQYNIVAVNMSFGKGHYTSPTTLSIVGTELATLNQMGVLLVASSGNDGVQYPLGIEYPAADPNVYAAGSVNASDVISAFTERGPDMDILAPGEDVPLIYYLPATGQRAIIAGSGTSFSVPFIAGMAALLKQIDPTLTPAEMMSIMQRSGVANFDGDKEAAPYTGLTWQRLNINNALAMTYAERDDIYENNDSMATATSLSFSADTASLNDLTLLKADADFYKFSLGTQADVDYALMRSGGTASPSVDLLDSHGTLIKHLGSTDELRLVAGAYYLRFNAPSTTLDGTYGFSITQTPDDGLNNQTPQTATPITLDADGHGEMDGLTLLGGADDYYSFTIDASSDVDVLVDYGGPSGSAGAQLLDTNGNFLATISGGGISRRLAAGRYLIRVFSPDTLADSYGVSVDAATFVTPGQNASSSAIAYDQAGNLYMAYYDEAAKNLKYAKRTAAGVWSSPSVIDPGNQTGQFVSLAIDSAGRPGVAYYDAANTALKYAHWNGASWDLMTVDSAFTTGYYPSLQFDAFDRPVISYYFKSSGDLRFAYLSGAATWNVSTIDSSGDVGRYSSLALNPATGRWTMAYEDTSHGWFKYAEQTKSGWAVTTVDNSTKVGGGYISLAFNPKNNRPAFSYYDAYNGDLKFASFNGSSWSKQSVATKGTVGLYSNLRIHADTGAIDILYYNKGADTLLRATFNANVWDYAQVAGEGGRWVSRAVDGDGNETVSYLQGTGLTVIDL
jgi:hypothetical protein